MNRRFGWAFVLAAMAATSFVAESQAAPAESPVLEVADPEFIGPPEIIHGKGWSALSETQRQRLDRKILKLRDQGPQGYPDQAEAFYVNSRTGPIITRGNQITRGVRSIGPEMYYEAMQHTRRMPRISSATGVRQPALGGNVRPFAPTPGNALGAWTNLGPTNQGGRTRALIIHPVSTDIMYAGGVAGGVWKSTDGGANWVALTDQMTNLAITTLAFRPGNFDTIYAGTGEGFGNVDAVRGAGIFRSTDAGATWTQLASTDTVNFRFTNKILVSPRNTLRIYAATSTGLWRSIDGGGSFAQVLNTSGVGGCTDMAMQVGGASGRVFVSCGRTSSQGTIYRGDDTDVSTFSSIQSIAGQGRSSIAVAPSNESVIYVMMSQSTAGAGPGQFGLHRILKSIDNGDNFTVQRQGNVAPGSTAVKINQLLLSNPVIALLTECAFGTSSFSNQGWYDNVIAVDPLDDTKVWVGGIDLWRSDNSGVDWGVASYWWFDKTDPEYAHADQHGIVFHPNYNGTSNATMFVANDGGVQRTSNARGAVGTTLNNICANSIPGTQVNWVDRSNGLVTTQFYDGAVYPDGQTYFGGLQDNGTLRGTIGNSNWSILAGGDGGYAAVDINAAGSGDDVLFLENTGNSLKRSTNGGASFANANTGITGTGFLFIAPFTMANANPDEIWTGGFDIWRSINQATAWSRATGVNGTCGAGSISAIAVHPANGNRVLVGMSDGCTHYNHAALTAPNTGLWPAGTVLSGGTGSGLGLVSWIAWDPNDQNIAYLAYSAFGVNNLYKSVNGGQTWTASVGAGATALPQIPVLSVVVNPNNSQQVFVGTDLGVYTSLDGGTSWYVENTGFSRSPVESLKFDSGANFLYAFTHGRGAWRSRVCNNCNLFTVGGTVSGLAAGNDVVLRNNGLDDLTVAANGAFTFPEPLQDTTAYAVTVRTNPTTPNQTCAVTNGSGTLAGANITNVAVNCTTVPYTINGMVFGLAPGNSVVLRNNGGNDLTVAANGAFAFSAGVPDGGGYAVTVFTNPTTPNQTCSVVNGSGTVSGANVLNVEVTCTTNTYTIGGTVSGLAAGNDVVLRNNGGNDLTVAANGAFTFSTSVIDGNAYAVTVFTNPTTPNQTCVVTNGSGNVAGANVTNVTVTCTAPTYTIGGTVSGLAAGNDVVLRNNGGNNLTVNANGGFTFSTPVADGGAYLVTVFTNPTTPNQTCIVTNAAGTVTGANVTNVAVTCTTNAYTIGGTVSGLAAGNDVVLQNNGGNDLTVNANGGFSFSTPVTDGNAYAVSVLTNPTTPNQTCLVTNGSGTVSGTNVTNVVVTCTTNSYTIGGTVSGLAAGNDVVLRNNGGNDLTVNANGGFTFSTPVADGNAYAVSVFTNPTTPNQTCIVTNAAGTVTGANVTNVAVTCTTNAYTIGGTVSGLAAGNDVVLQNNGGNNLTVNANGGFTFSTAIADGGAYLVTVLTNPTTPDQTCSVTSGSGNVAGTNVTNVTVTCTSPTYTIGGTVSGLAAGNDVVLRNNGGNNLTVNANGGFTFSTPVADGGAYLVTVFTNPTTPSQTCIVTNAAGTVTGANVTNVAVTCTTNTYTIGGTVSGLAAGNDVVLQNNSGNNLTVNANGGFTFSTPVTDGNAYAVSVFTNPTTPNQTCLVTNGSGTVSGTNVTNVVVACTTNTYTIGGTVSGLAAGNDVVLRNNGGNNLTVNANGGFTFSTPVADGGAYLVTVFTNPTTPNQTCIVTTGAGIVAGANVTNVAVTCTTNAYSVGGTVSGLAAGNDVVLQNNGGNNLTVNANGGFTFSTPVTDGGAYGVTVLTNPTTPDQTCSVTNGSGNVAGANVTNVTVTCSAPTYTIGGTVSGLAGGNAVVLRNNGGNDLTVNANGGFTFSTPVADGGAYLVTVFTNPTTPNQTCVATNGSGNVTGANVTNVVVTCTTNAYTIGGTVSGLAAGNDVVLRNNGGDDLTVAANGGFTFSTPVTDGNAYVVSVFTNPTTPNQTCVATNAAGTVTGANITNVAITCTTNAYTIGGTVSGLAAGNDVVLRNNGGNDLTVNANGSFVFSTPVNDGGAYAVTVSTNPTTPNQTCAVTSGSGTVAGTNVTTVAVACATNTYTVGGTVSGLAAGNDVVLRNNGGNDLTVNANGGFTFSTPVTDGNAYAASVFTNPTTPNQTCVATNAAGTVTGANVTNVAITCTTNAYTIGGTVSGLAAGNDVVLRNNGGNDLTVNANGSFAFSTPVNDGGAYAVTVSTNPTTPNQTCAVTNAGGTVSGTNVTNVVVSCTTNTYTIGGTVSGLAVGNDVVLQNNGGNNLTVAANGAFTFSTPITDGVAYAVTVLTNPTTPNQTCVVTNAGGNVAGTNVTNVAVTCTTNTYTIGGTVSGLAAGNDVVLQNNGGNNLTINANGAFAFSNAITDGGTYAVTVLTNPTTPNQTCAVTSGSGTVNGTNVATVAVACTTNTYSIGGSVAGLASGNSVVLRNNGGDNLTVNANGTFTFAAPITDGTTYDVTVLTQPTTPNQTCAVTLGSGQLAGVDVTNVAVTCTTNTYSIGGTISGLASGATVILLNGGGDPLPVNANGAFVFATPITDETAFAVTVGTQPDNKFEQQCLIDAGSGTVAGTNVTSVVVTCLPNAIFRDGFE